MSSDVGGVGGGAEGAVEWGAVVKVMAHVALSSVKSGTMQKMS